VRSDPTNPDLAEAARDSDSAFLRRIQRDYPELYEMSADVDVSVNLGQLELDPLDRLKGVANVTRLRGLARGPTPNR